MSVSKKELPPICPDGEHDWIEASVHGCGALPDDHVLEEAIVIGFKGEGGPGSVCNRCFQKWEQPGERDPDLVSVYLERMSWEKNEI